jgi:hypothetical protein
MIRPAHGTQPRYRRFGSRLSTVDFALHSVEKIAITAQTAISRDAKPFRIERLSADRFSRPTVPVRRVVRIAFLTMQVGVHPRTLGPFVLLGRFVCPLPIALGVPPETIECESEFRRRLGLGERILKIFQGHFGALERLDRTSNFRDDSQQAIRTALKKDS